MKYFADLHLHSKHSSDGEQTLEEIFQRSKKSGLSVAVITDHNLVLPLSSLKIASKFKLKTFQGTEISASFSKTEVHILAYSLNFDTPLLERMLTPIREGYNHRAQEILERLKKNKIANLDFKKLLKKRTESYISRHDIALELSKVKDIPYREAFSFLSEEGLAYVPYGSWAPLPREVCQKVRKAGGISVFAHPARTLEKFQKKSKEKYFWKLWQELLESGISGVEVNYSLHSEAQKKFWQKEAQKRKLLETGGSDYHGEFFTSQVPPGSGGVTKIQFEKILANLK